MKTNTLEKHKTNSAVDKLVHSASKKGLKVDKYFSDFSRFYTGVPPASVNGQILNYFELSSSLHSSLQRPLYQTCTNSSFSREQ